jgi:hypothetical protein
MSKISVQPLDPNQRLDTNQTAALIGESTSHLMNLRSQGKSLIKFEKHGRTVRYKYGDILDYLESLPKFQA